MLREPPKGAKQFASATGGVVPIHHVVVVVVVAVVVVLVLVGTMNSSRTTPAVEDADTAQLDFRGAFGGKESL